MGFLMKLFLLLSLLAFVCLKTFDFAYESGYKHGIIIGCWDNGSPADLIETCIRKNK